MANLIQELVSGNAVLQIDARNPVGDMDKIVEDMTFLNYRLGSVQARDAVEKSEPDVIWECGAGTKDIRYEGGKLHLDGQWSRGS